MRINQIFFDIVNKILRSRNNHEKVYEVRVNKPITNEFDWNRSDLAGAVTIGTIIGGIVASFVGPILDRFGPRWILSFSFLF